MRELRVLENEEIRVHAPSVFADRPVENTSDRYLFVPTIKIVDMFRDVGWYPVTARQSSSRTTEGQIHTKHLVRFRTKQLNDIFDDVAPEILLVNSHNKLCTFQLMAGLFRFVCVNGLVVSDSMFSKISIKHVGFDENKVIDATYRIVDDIPKIDNCMQTYKSIDLSPYEQLMFAKRASLLRWEEGKAPVTPGFLLETHRGEDKPNNLWSTYNVVQENIIKRGGIDSSYRVGRRFKVRQIKGVSNDLKINKHLWELMDSVAKEKTAVIDTSIV